jgi:hypothetical protein
VSSEEGSKPQWWPRVWRTSRPETPDPAFLDSDGPPTDNQLTSDGPTARGWVISGANGPTSSTCFLNFFFELMFSVFSSRWDISVENLWYSLTIIRYYSVKVIVHATPNAVSRILPNANVMLHACTPENPASTSAFASICHLARSATCIASN